MKIDIEHKDWPEDESWREKLPQGNPFGVPSGYFDDLHQRIISGIHLQEIKQQAGATGGFTVPENYFDGLSSNISSRIAIDNALAAADNGFTVPGNYFDELSSNIQSRIAIQEALDGAEAQNTFAVPEGYFDNLEQQITSRIQLEEAAPSHEQPFAVPEGYFDNLEQQISSRIQVEEMLEASSEHFTVPDGYFESLEQNILSKTTGATETREAKVVPLKPQYGVIRKLVSSAAFKYASAACFALIVGLVIFIKDEMNPSAKHNRSYLHKEVSALATDDIRAYLETQTGATETERAVVAKGTQFDNSSLRQALQEDLGVQ